MISGTPLQTRTLAPLFTWHGFQYVVVAPGEGVQFKPDLKALKAYWTTAALAESSVIEFSGPGASLLSDIRDITKASQISNMAGYTPTDCPTREKHGWLGDSQVTAEEAMYNLWSPNIYRRFLSDVRDSQHTEGTLAGFVAGVVPGATSVTPPADNGQSKGLDISWTAAYLLDATWLLTYYGDTSILREHWPSLKAYVDGHLRVADNHTAMDGLPDYWTWGDWCAVESRALATPGTGPQAAAGNFLMALKGASEIADALGLESDSR